MLEVSGAPLDQNLDGRPLADALMEPTRIYVKPLLELFKAVKVKALAHITGGGLLENIPRVLPENTNARIDSQSWELPAVFAWLQQQGNIAPSEMYRTFNCGVGMVICVASADAEKTMEVLKAAGEQPWLIGTIEQSEQSTPEVLI